MKNAKKREKFLNKRVPACIKKKVMRIIKELNSHENPDDKSQINKD